MRGPAYTYTASTLGDNTIQRWNWIMATARELGIGERDVVDHLRRAGYAR